VCRNSDLSFQYKQMVAEGVIEPHSQMTFFLRIKAHKSTSGILSVTVFTSPRPEYTDPATGKKKTQKFTCKWNCYYCPNHPDHPRSYLPDEPGCMRAERCGFDAVRQMDDRVGCLHTIGHPVDKLEVLVLGGTWESYPAAYREEYCRDLFYAANVFFDAEPKRERLSLADEQTINETARCKIIGLTLETRPDTIDAESIRTLRAYGATRVQIGVQHIDDEILTKVNRQHGREDTERALKLLTDNCFKVDIHLMPDLPFASPEIDEKMFAEILGVDFAVQAAGVPGKALSGAEIALSTSEAATTLGGLDQVGVITSNAHSFPSFYCCCSLFSFRLRFRFFVRERIFSRGGLHNDRWLYEDAYINWRMWTNNNNYPRRYRGLIWIGRRPGNLKRPRPPVSCLFTASPTFSSFLLFTG
jgi:hypothetical protein